VSHEKLKKQVAVEMEQLKNLLTSYEATIAREQSQKDAKPVMNKSTYGKKGLYEK
jgi:hypothetical protein